MNFTLDAYAELLNLIRNNDYDIRDYHNYEDSNKFVILRHDVDFDLRKAAKFAQIEKELNVKSVYFVLVSSDFYNVLSPYNIKCVEDIIACGHEVGLHFDEAKYVDKDIRRIENEIYREADFLGNVIGKKVRTISMHRPSQQILEADLKLNGMVNTYGSVFFKEFKYLSDARMNWRVSPEPVIVSGDYNKIQLLTHPFWYTKHDRTMTEKLKSFVLRASRERYIELGANIRNIEDALPREELKNVL